MASLKHHFQLAVLSLDQSPCCQICFLGTDWFLSMKWSSSEAWSRRYQMKLAGSRFKTSHRKSYRASCSKMWPIWNVLMVSWGDCVISCQKNALKIDKSVESTPGPGSPVPLMAGVWESTLWRYPFIHFCEFLLFGYRQKHDTGLYRLLVWSSMAFLRFSC